MTTSPPDPRAPAGLSGPPTYQTVGPNAIAYHTVGSGPTLVCITGWPFHSATYHRLVARLADRYRCVLLDSPGLGLTRWSDATDFTFPGQAATFSGFLDGLGIEEYYLLAHDTGATIARLMAAEHGSRVRGFAILNTEIPRERPPWFPLYARLMRLPGSAALFRVPLRWQTFLRSPMGFGGCYADPSLVDDRFVATYIQPLLDDAQRLDGAMRYLSIGLDFDLIDALPEVHAHITAPVHLIWGQADPTFPVAGARRMATEFANGSGITEIERGKLLVHEEFPEPVAVAVRRAFKAD
ncbi:MAG: alpha/beta hydrolase [Bacteroidota bacterium]